MPAPEARLFLIGNELVEGRLVDRNGSFLAAELTELGFFVSEVRLLPDDPARLRAAMQDALQSEARLLLSSGGLGHTTDDLTAALWAEVLGDTLILSESLLQRLRSALERRGITPLPYLERYALVPTHGEALLNPVGLAPALYWEKGLQVICALPGPPAELRAIWQTHLKPRLMSRFPLEPPLHHTLRTTGITESGVSALLAEWEKALSPAFHLAYNPSWEGVSLHLRAAPGTDADAFWAQVEQLKSLLAPYLYAEGSIPLAEAILHRLKAARLTLAVAESCTGGHLAAEIVNISGASEAFLGGIVSYANSAKEGLLKVSPQTLATEGAVSEATARQMAEGVRAAFGADIGVATTGIAGPTGGSPEKPVGTVWFSIVTPWGTEARRYVFPGDRQVVIQRATATALSLLWQTLQKQPAS